MSYFVGEFHRGWSGARKDLVDLTFRQMALATITPCQQSKRQQTVQSFDPDKVGASPKRLLELVGKRTERRQALALLVSRPDRRAGRVTA